MCKIRSCHNESYIFGIQSDVKKIVMFTALHIVMPFVCCAFCFVRIAILRASSSSVSPKNKSFTHNVCVSYIALFCVVENFFFSKVFLFFSRAPAWWWDLKINYRKIVSWHVLCCRVFFLCLFALSLHIYTQPVYACTIMFHRQVKLLCLYLHYYKH